jgi:2-isopropylmalate synthase
MSFLNPTEIGGFLLTPKVSPRLSIHDITLREGEQAADVNFSLDDKLRIADDLVAAGVRRIQGGFPGRSQNDAQFIAAAKERGYAAEIEANIQLFAEDWRRQIDVATKVRADVASMLFPCSNIRLEHLALSQDKVEARITEAITYVRDNGLHARFTPTDTTRADLSVLLRLDEIALRAGARAVSISDTVGCATPHSIQYIVSAVVRAFGVPVHVHCHNDFGLAMANALAAVEAGAEVIDTTINGLGERAGNLDMAQFVATMKVLFGVDLGIDLKQLTPLSRLVTELSGVAPAATQPLTGPNSFAHKLDGHIQLLEKKSELIEFLNAGIVGNERRLPLGKHTGPYVVQRKLNDLGLKVETGGVTRIIDEIHRKAASEHRSLSDSEFASIARQMIQN